MLWYKNFFQEGKKIWVHIFRPVMKEHMKYIIDHAEEIEKLIKVKAQVSEVKSIMLENIDKVILEEGMNLFNFIFSWFSAISLCSCLCASWSNL